MSKTMTVSNCLLGMMISGEGWRNHYDSSGVTDFKEILTYELKELGNTDIIDFVQKNYIGNGFPILDYKKISLNKVIDDTVDYIRSLFTSDKNKKVNAVWLTDYQNVLDKYIYGENDIVLARIPIHELNMRPVSDLGYDGALFVTVEDLNFDDYISGASMGDQIDYKEYANSLRENAIKDENGNIICSPVLWEQIASIIENI